MQAGAGDLVGRMLRAARLDVHLYEEVEKDTNATTQALTVVIIVAIASAIGAAIGTALLGVGGSIVGGIIGGIIQALLGWVIWSMVVYFVGTRFFGGVATPGEVLRTIGFAYTPGVLVILIFIPVLGVLLALAAFVWQIVAGVIAVRQALDFDTGKAIATVLIGFVGVLIMAAILNAIGLGMAAV